MPSSGMDEGGWVQGLCVWGADIQQVRVLVRVGGVERDAQRFSKQFA